MLITGASQRIGAAIARIAHAQGYRVVVHYRSAVDAASKLVDSLNSIRRNSAICVATDLCESGRCKPLVDSVLDQWGRFDVLVNNASEFFPTPLGAVERQQLDKIFSANVFAPLLLTQAALPALRRHQGAVVNIVDIFGELVHPQHSVYCASKAALSMLTRSLAHECAPEVRVNGVAPGAILWPEGVGAKSEREKKRILEQIPLRKTGSVEQIAAAVLYLCSDDAAFVTGQVLSVDGGRTL